MEIEKGPSRGTILIQQGHNEFIEKYFETIQEFIDKKYSVITFDWRGQGMSDHQINDIHKAYIEDFKRHDRDLEFILDKIINNNFSKTSNRNRSLNGRLFNAISIL